MRTLQRMGVGVLALTLTAGVAACGSDDDSTADTTTTAASEDGDLVAFCDAVLDLNTAVSGVEVDETTPAEDVTAAGESLAEPLAAILDSAPTALVAPAQEVNAFVEPMVEGDAAAFNDEAAFATYSSFLTDATAACPFASVPVTAVDFAFEDVPETVAAGTTAFALTNTSTVEDHEMIVMRKADGVLLSFDELLALGEEEAADQVEFIAAGFAPTGGDPGTVLAELTPGSYAMLCFIPVGGAEDGPPHFTQGMKQEFTVE